MTDTKLYKKLGPNVSSFEAHIAIGLEAAGLNINDFDPAYMEHTEDKSKGVGFGIQQQKHDSSSYVCCFEDGLQFPEGGSSIVICDDQPASTVAVLVLVAILSGRLLESPECPHCQEEA
tara:strand:+ start:1125 stop:1481 length:357 start_codon:yes stop_codon:yes gene_type:complete